jgi:hypothetical protein
MNYDFDELSRLANELRANIPPKDFIKHCMTQVSENLIDLEDQWKFMKVAAEKLA